MFIDDTLAQPDNIFVVKLSDDERETGDLTPINLFEAIDAFYGVGVVVLDNTIRVEYIDRLNGRMMKDTEILMSNQEKIHWK